ncbi:glycosyltransferase involved in cell wall biosynthesis [Parabacteroides sp. PF5-5]|uniref:glycosyltransferase n=1 Tax=unclassified Parabacteroides TaxID=2649774 RepID=UPI0024745DF5|nr:MULTISPECIES: glycosyltransferase [unclassified Parabacteroides]MDH6316371.1 glycosyltransferase involved in cell wall biosynthesis [Parabacteroides sp. PF5-13]MDH6327558.1 glycosyltransferase involved in cell wall biosynthesis [Parabacteroides sp. PH5-41]MDH6335302.1 glycosyltransferase involved in cell wall biosynthesis [Parabacteroides sp. PF5-5]MDH6346365.1 glycosyltransferase involved in cell wall biosynthesis [Parabacteroides sp. PH5-46]MDH6361384.1 glycosyltransferase involved in cel
MIKVLLNATSIDDGGGVQITLNFFRNTIDEANGFIWYYVISEKILTFMVKNSIYLPKDKLLVVKKRPSSIKYGKSIKKTILEFELKNEINLVYSLGAPSYIPFRSREIQRLTNPYIIKPNKYAYKTFPFWLRLQRYVKTYLQRIAVEDCEYFITQTPLARSQIIKRFNISPDNVYVISNALADCFLNVNNTSRKLDDNIIFCLAAPNFHKNIVKIPFVAYLLRKKMHEENFKFIITIEKEHPIYKEVLIQSEAFGVSDLVENVGKLTQNECVDVYLQSKIVFLPTYLEVFSATLIESMKMGVPIVATNFDFNTVVAKDAAFYFEPNDWESAADALFVMLSDERKRRQYIEKGRQIVGNIPTTTDVYYSICEIIRKINLKW